MNIEKLENLEVGNCCYINDNYNTLWLIIGINGNAIMLKSLKTKNKRVVDIKQISQIIEN